MSSSAVAMFSPHARVLVRVGRNPDVRLRDIADDLAMTERNVQNLVRDLQHAGLVEVERRGRRNRYRVNGRRRIGQELGRSMTVRELLRLAGADQSGAEQPAPEPGENNPSKNNRNPSIVKPEVEPVPAAAEDHHQLDWLGNND